MNSKSNELMNKEEIEKAAKQWFIIKKKYPEFCKMFYSIIDMSKGPSIQEVADELIKAEEANRLRKEQELMVAMETIYTSKYNNRYIKKIRQIK